MFSEYAQPHPSDAAESGPRLRTMLAEIWHTRFAGSNKVEAVVRSLRKKLGPFAPSVETVTGELQLATPLVAPEHEKVTVTLVLFQPAAFGGGLTEAVIFGGVSSVPANSMVSPLPGLLRSSTVNVLFLSRVTVRVKRDTCWLKSLSTKIATPLNVMMALDTRSY